MTAHKKFKQAFQGSSSLLFVQSYKCLFVFDLILIEHEKVCIARSVDF